MVRQPAMVIGFASPVRVAKAGSVPVTCAAVLWRAEGKSRVTVIAKATFAVQPEGAMRPIEALPIVTADAHHEGDPRRSLRAASEVAPYLGQGDVLLTGHAYASPGRPATTGGARLAIVRDGAVLFDKSLRIQADRAPDGSAVPFAYMPLVHERALYHPEENPVGADPRRGRNPNLVGALAPSRPATFGPLARIWPSRHRLLGDHDPRSIDGATLTIPEGFAWAYFQSAPLDQRIDHVRGDEMILLGGMHPAIPMVRTTLPGARAIARVFGLSPRPADLAMRADTLSIDTDAQTVSVVWRGHFEVEEASLASLDVIVGVGLEGTSPILPTTITAAAIAPDDDDDLEAGTLMLDDESTSVSTASDDDDLAPETVMVDDVAAALGGRALPFDPNAPVAPFAKGSAAPPRTYEDDDEGGNAATITALFDAALGGRTLPFAGTEKPAPPAPVAAIDAPPPPAFAAPIAFPPSVTPAQVLPPAAGADHDDDDDDEKWSSTVGLSPEDAVRLISPVALPFEEAPDASPRAPAAPAAPPPESPWAEADPSLPKALEIGDDPLEATMTIERPALFRERDGEGPPPEIPERTTEAIPVFSSVPFVLVTMPWQVRPPRDSLTVIVKGSFAINQGGAATMLDESAYPTGDVHLDDDLEKSTLYPSDFAIFKPKADVVVTGHAVAPGGSSPAAEVRVSFGHEGAGFSRRLVVFGERRWQKSLLTLAPTDPQPFTTIALTYENAFGGAGFDQNPVGRGYKAAAGPDGVARLPHLEDPEHLIQSPSAKPHPACFAPLPTLWRERWSLLGHYDARWLKTRWPYFPDDFDWNHFQSAPRSQRLDYLRGDEPFAITGMHREHARLWGTLPGLAARCFMQKTEEAGGAFEEALLRLDTASFDIDTMTLQLVWRAVIEVSDEDAPEIAAFYLMADPLGVTTSLEDARARMIALAHATEDVEDSPDGEPGVANDLDDEPTPNPEEAAAEAAAEAKFRELDEQMKAAGIETPTAPLEVTPPDPQAIAKTLREAGASEEDIASLLEAMALEPPRAFGPNLRERVIAQLEAGDPFDGMDLEHADLSGLDFSGQSLVGASLRQARLIGTRFDSAAMSGALLAGANLTDASFEGADLENADFTGANLDAARFGGALVSDADFSEARGERAQFQGVRGESAVFVEGNWTGACFDGCALSAADFSRARLDEASFAKASMPDVQLYDAVGNKTSFDEANLPDARCDGAALPFASFRKVHAPSSIWEKAKLEDASFIGAELPGSSFIRASCARANFSGADLTEAAMRRAKLPGAQLFKANLMKATLERADLTKADLRGANLHGVETWKADFTGADLDYAIVTMTKLRGRS